MKTVSISSLVIPAVVLRLVFSALFFHPDIKSQHFHAQFLSRGVIDIYQYIAGNRDKLPYTDTFNYPPLTYYFLGSWNFIAGKVLGPGFYAWLNDWGPSGFTHSRMFEFMLVLKFPYLLMDLLIAVMLCRFSPRRQWLLPLWLFNPLSLYAVYALGQFDILPATLTVAALLFTTRKQPLPAALMLGLGAALKTYPLLLLPFVLIRSGNIRRFILGLVLGLAGFLLPLLPVINSPAFRYSMSHSNLMQGIFYASIPVSPGQNLPVFILVWALVFWLSWRRKSGFNLLPEFFTVTFSVLLFSHFHAQWLVWSLPFLVLLVSNNIRLWLTAVAVAVGYFATVFLISDQYVLLGLFSPINPQSLIFPPLSDLVKPWLQPEFLQSLFHTLLAASGLWLIFAAWKTYDTE